MANQDFTLKRKTGTDTYDILHPTTTVEQIHRASDDKTLQTLLDEKVSYDSETGKIAVADLPAEVMGGLTFKGSLSSDTDLDTLVDDADISEISVGRFWIAGSNVELTSTSTNATIQPPGDEGEYTLPLTIESGDWLVLVEWSSTAQTFAIIDNDYTYAGTTVHGLVKLSDTSSISSSASSDDVITETVLGNLLGTDTGSIAKGDHSHSNYVQNAGDTMTGNLTLDRVSATDSGSQGIIFRGNSVSTDFSKELNMNLDGGLNFEGKEVFYRTGTDVGKLFYDNDTDAVEGDFVIELDD